MKKDCPETPAGLSPPMNCFEDEGIYKGFLTAVLNSIPDPICVKDRLHRWIFVNDTFCAFTGQKRSSLLGRSDYEFFPKKEADVFWEKDEEVFRTGKENINEETITDSSGTTRTIVTKKTLYSRPSGEDYIVAIGRDITIHKQMDEALRREKNRVQKYLDIAGVILVVIGTDQRVEMINRKGCDILGYTEEEIVGKKWFDTFVSESARKKVKQVFKMLMRGEIKNTEYYENTVVTKAGEERLIAWHNTLLKGESEKIIGTLSSGEDITERKAAENELREKEELLRRSQKLEAIGRLAGGIAHDFNNLLTAIIGYTELLKMSESLDTNTLINVEEIRRAADRAADLTQQLLAFSRKQVLRPTIINLNKMIVGIENMLTRIIGENIRLVTRLCAELGPIRADPGQIEQVIINLIVNARDAMPMGGTVVIETKNVYLDSRYREEHSGVLEGDYVLLAISDTGHGMARETKERIFEPFFTTKAKGKGTGLGLSTVYGIVKQSGGNVWVYSELEQGTTFKIYLPMVEEEKEERRSREKPQIPNGGSELLLVVEDEDIVRKMIHDSLRSFGYTVLEARTGSEALELCMQQGLERVQLLITDVVMPEMSGKDLADRLTTIYPGMKVLFISGYTDNAIVHHGMLDRGIQFLEKPFSPQTLARKIREILDTV